ncbi:hypothetical protein [Amycolatopsis sp. VC5-11]|uniref:hypothetical protein n=1 Tax=Amycolatopsis sp. VC5-11 TaxID=3120156 RepID=UPI0030083ED1
MLVDPFERGRDIRVVVQAGISGCLGRSSAGQFGEAGAVGVADLLVCVVEHLLHLRPRAKIRLLVPRRDRADADAEVCGETLIAHSESGLQC